MKRIVIVLTSLIVFLTAPVAFGTAEGKAGSGGGSTWNNAILEEFGGQKASDLPGYEEALREMRQFVPLMAYDMNELIRGKNLFVIPKQTFDELPEHITGLYIKTKTACVQSANEIF
jgi:hypothetical protein